MMDKLTEIPPGKTLFEQLEEKHQLPVSIIKNDTHCAGCNKPFNPRRQPAAESHSTPEGIPIPILYLSLLCEVCVTKYCHGGSRQRRVLAAIEKNLAREVLQ
jgi:hypothetical protein